MRVSCLMPTFGRGHCRHLVEEAVYSFLVQDYPDKELIILNDTPGLRLHYGGDSRVRVINQNFRFATLSTKLQAMIPRATGDVLCRWDDDDISLPWRLSLSLERLRATGGEEWHPDAYWYWPIGDRLYRNVGHGNSHITSVWTRAALAKIGGYPAGLSGNEDQAFNTKLLEAGLFNEEAIDTENIFYLYRWGVSEHHLSGAKADAMGGCQDHYNRIGERPQVGGEVHLEPRWLENYAAVASRACTAAAPAR
jgi:glycosyltransferase involved in cell wall biosynthesis